MACSSGCPTKTHSTYGECMREKTPRTVGLDGQDRSAQKKLDSTLDAYRDARRQGIQPAGTDAASVRRAVELSDRTGQAWQA